MLRKKIVGFNQLLERFAYWITYCTGTSAAFTLAAAVTVLWLVSGPFFHYSDTWQLVMNTLSSVVTFLMVFLFQRSQNKDTLAIQVKLNELIAAMKGADNRMIAIEDLSEEEVRALHERYLKLAVEVEKAQLFVGSVSVEELVCEPASEIRKASGLDSTKPAP